MRIREIAQARVRYGYRKILALLHREGWKVGTHLVYRLYQEEGLTLRQRRRRRVALPRRERQKPSGPNQVWSLNFVADQLAYRRRFRAFTVVDVFTRERLAIEAGQSLKGEDVAKVLSRIKAQRGAPKMLFCDNVLPSLSSFFAKSQDAQGSPCWLAASEGVGLSQAPSTNYGMKLSS